MNRKLINLLKRILRAKKLSLSLLIAIIAFVFSFNQVSSFNQSFTTFLTQKNLEKELTGKVSRVIDGDTIELLVKQEDIKQSPKIKVRLFGIDAPEKKQAFGKEAKEYLSSLILDKEIILIINDKDKYQRTIGTILLNDKDINKEMVKNGYAWAYESYSTKYLAEQADAQMFKLGLWKDENAIKPSEFRNKNR
ncbi:thermonuclease family protein [Campylobacter helveticus]|uniref:thermonuclease family protein n=1 Tax=Campylobacter helveticus TaxID=28898 RepID=UPI00111640DE|nr:thermonuclease family protein [Campylobacter helveticus]TNH33899.1 thermonuclease [Campylobacter helveticus]TNH36350.1 thermonuclease [Campylobacter helveticus]